MTRTANDVRFPVVMITGGEMAKAASDRKASAVDFHVGARVRIRRQELGLTQAELAGQLGLTFQQLYKYERGESRIAAGRLFELACALGVEPGWFFEGLARAKGSGGSPNHAPPELAAFNPKVVEAAQALLRIEDAKVRNQLMKTILAIGGDDVVMGD
jgi:transcriptional regulator with XRE-family HTH domain